MAAIDSALTMTAWAGDKGIVMDTIAIASSLQPFTLVKESAKSSTVQSNQEAPDQSLIKAIAGGDRRAMHTLYARHNVRIYRFILRLIQNASLAEDLVSEVFLTVWRDARTFKGKSQVSTWLLAIARYKAISAMRRRYDEQLDEEALTVVEDPADNPHVLLEQGDRAVIVRKCLAELSPSHREVLDLVYYHEKSVDEVAEIVGIPVGTAKTRMFYARNHMERILKLAGVDAF